MTEADRQILYACLHATENALVSHVQSLAHTAVTVVPPAHDDPFACEACGALVGWTKVRANICQLWDHTVSGVKCSGSGEEYGLGEPQACDFPCDEHSEIACEECYS